MGQNIEVAKRQILGITFAKMKYAKYLWSSISPKQIKKMNGKMPKNKVSKNQNVIKECIEALADPGGI